jgi:hypothetical protein
MRAAEPVSRIDPETRRITSDNPARRQPEAIAVADRAVLVAASAGLETP